ILHPGDSISVDVTFDPLTSGAHTGTLVIETDAEDFPGRIDLRGEGQRTTADLREELLNNNFGGVAVGHTLDQARDGALLTNHGLQPVTISDVHMAAGPGESEFVVVDFHPVTLQPGESLVVQMNFRPSAAGLRHGILEIVSNDPNSPVIRKPLVGTGT